MKGAFIRKDYSLPDLVNYYGKETPLESSFDISSDSPNMRKK
jgi:hypothetical protein